MAKRWARPRPQQAHANSTAATPNTHRLALPNTVRSAFSSCAPNAWVSIDRPDQPLEVALEQESDAEDVGGRQSRPAGSGGAPPASGARRNTGP